MEDEYSEDASHGRIDQETGKKTLQCLLQVLPDTGEISRVDQNEKQGKRKVDHVSFPPSM